MQGETALEKVWPDFLGRVPVPAQPRSRPGRVSASKSLQLTNQTRNSLDFRRETCLTSSRLLRGQAAFLSASAGDRLQVAHPAAHPTPVSLEEFV